MEEKDKKKSKWKKLMMIAKEEGINVVVCLPGGVYMLVRFKGDMKNWNLFQKVIDSFTQEEVKSYCARNKEGYPTGNGQAFEDLFFMYCRNKGYKIEKCAPEKNGSDFIVNGMAVQLKYSSNPDTIIHHLYDKKTGEYRYPGQVLVVGKGAEEPIRKGLEKKAEQGLDTPETIYETEIDKADIHKFMHRGIDSLKMDMQNVYFQKTLAIGFAVGLASALIYYIYKEYNESPQKSVKQAAGRAVKKRGIKMLFWSAFVAFIGGAGYLGYRQYVRPA